MEKAGLVCVILFCIFCGPLFGQDGGESANNQKIQKILSKVEKAKGESLWQYARALAESEEESLAYMNKNYDRLSPKGQLIFAKVALQKGRHSKGLAMVRKLIFSSQRTLSLRLMALGLLERFAKKESDTAGLENLLSKPSAPALLKIQAAKVLRKIGRDPRGSRFLRRYLRASDFQIRTQSALALGEIGNSSFRIRKILNQLADEPTAQGLHARSLLEQMKLMDSLAQTQGLSQKMQLRALQEKIRDLKRKNKALQLKMEMGINSGQALLDEIMGKIERYYDYRDPKEIDKKHMIEAAAKGITNSLDPHSIYFNLQETKKFKESMSSKYPGIGAYVQKNPQGYVKISQPIYSGPAYKAGLRSGDVIVKILLKGKWVTTQKFKISELVNHLRGPGGTKVQLKIWRDGWKKPKEFLIARQFIKIPLVYTSLLPGGIGYLRLTSFGEKCEVEVEKGLKKLEVLDMKGLILDLRGNPGGYLRSAVEIADKFLTGGKLIVYSKGRNPYKAPRRDYHSTNKTHSPYPVVVLVNGNSASAAEILSGALKLHKRAILIGTRTYGKGSVQELMPLRSTGNKAMLKLTIAKYYLPDGTNIDHKGIEPNIKVNPSKIPFSVDEYGKLLKKDSLDKYLDNYYKKNHDLFEKLARFDNHNPSQYPHFSELYKSLKTHLPKEAVRRALRYKVRQRRADELGHLLVGDFQEDVQLQAAILEILKKLGLAPNKIGPYKKIKEKVAKALMK